MPYISSPSDGASLFYIDYRPFTDLIFRPEEDSIAKNKDKTLLFIHGWPMSGRMYEHLMLPLSQTHGVRCIAIDRRGFGKSEWQGPEPLEVTYDTFAEDTFTIIKSIKDLGQFTFVASSMGCGESLLVYELMRKHGLERRVQGFIWMGPSLPYPLKADFNPHAPPQEVWDMILDGFRQDRTAFVKASIGGVFGTQHGIAMSETAQEFYVDLVKQADAIAIERCCQILSRYDFNEKLKSFGNTKPDDVKLTVIHGEKDQSKSLQPRDAIRANMPHACHSKPAPGRSRVLYPMSNSRYTAMRHTAFITPQQAKSWRTSLLSSVRAAASGTTHASITFCMQGSLREPIKTVSSHVLVLRVMLMNRHFLSISSLHQYDPLSRCSISDETLILISQPCCCITNN